MQFPLSGWRRRWLSSRIEDPSSLAADDDVRADYRLLAEGLGSLLAQCSRRGAERQFPAALAGARRLRRQRRMGTRPGLAAQQLSDLCHEIAEYADQATLDAALRCLRREAESRTPTPPSSLTDDSSGFDEEPTRPMRYAVPRAAQRPRA